MTEFQSWLLGEWTVHEFCIEQGAVTQPQMRKLEALKRDLKLELRPDMDRLENEGANRLYRQAFFKRAPEVLRG